MPQQLLQDHHKFDLQTGFSDLHSLCCMHLMTRQL